MLGFYGQSLNIGVCGSVVTPCNPYDSRGVYESYLIIMGRLILKIFKMDHPFTIYNYIDKKITTAATLSTAVVLV